MKKLKNSTSSRTTTLNRRHTDAGEHALSILLAKNELGSQFNSEFPSSTLPIEHDKCISISDSNSNPGLFKRIFRSRSYKRSNNVTESSKTHLSLTKNVTHLDETGLKFFNKPTFVYFLYESGLYKVDLPLVLTFDWISANFLKIFKLDIPNNQDINVSFLIKLPESNFFQPLIELQQVTDRSILSINAPNNFDFQYQTRFNRDNFSCSTRSFSKNFHRDILSDHFIVICSNLSNIRKDLRTLKLAALNFYTDYLHAFQSTSNYIVSEFSKLLHSDSITPSLSQNPHFRYERLNIHSNESAYFSKSSDIYTELELLELSIENIRLDVAKRGCQIVNHEVEVLNSSVYDIETILLALRKQFLELEPNLRRIMAFELEVIVLEEDFVNNEGFRLEDSILKCRHLNNTLIALRELSIIQGSRNLFSVEFSVKPIITSEVHETLMNEIRSTKIDPATRLKSIEMSRQIYNRRKLFLYDPMKAFTKDLQVQKAFLKKTNNFSIIENRNNLNYHMWLEDFKREKFIQRSRDKQMSNTNFTVPYYVSPKQLYPLPLNPHTKSRWIHINRNVSTFMEPNPLQNYGKSLSETTLFPDINTTPTSFINKRPLCKRNVIDTCYINSESYKTLIPPVPGPPDISNNSFRYYTRPQEIHSTKINPTKSSSTLQQFSVV